MIAHYTQAAIVAESRRLAVPAAVDSLPTSAMQEDHVSMGWGAARKLRHAIANLQRIVAIELMVAARALDLRAPLRPAEGTEAARAAVRELVPGFGPDRHVAPELREVAGAVADGRLLARVEAQIGALA
jgi:histidine ammonia-lyase